MGHHNENEEQELLSPVKRNDNTQDDDDFDQYHFSPDYGCERKRSSQPITNRKPQKRPRGRPPNNTTWDSNTGEYIPVSKPVSKPVIKYKKRRPGRPPKGKTWDGVKGDYVPTKTQIKTNKPNNLRDKHMMTERQQMKYVLGLSSTKVLNNRNQQQGADYGEKWASINHPDWKLIRSATSKSFAEYIITVPGKAPVLVKRLTQWEPGKPGRPPLWTSNSTT